MSFDLPEFGRKLRNYREQRQLTLDELGPDTGIANERLAELEGEEDSGTKTYSHVAGDDVIVSFDKNTKDYIELIKGNRQRRSANFQLAGHAHLAELFHFVVIDLASPRA